jgi:RimJ/RimL family protein N-acetyltransferase
MDLSIRSLNELDFDDVVSWRSDLTTRKMAKYTGEITKEGFRPVFNRYLVNPSYIIDGIFDRGLSDGIAIITLTPVDGIGQYEIGINMNPAYRGKNLSKSILQLCLEHIKTSRLSQISSIIAMIKQENIASIKLFTGVGFQQITSLEPGYLQYMYIL